MPVLRPEPMQRTVIVAARPHEKTVIETLHHLHAAHIVDFVETREGDLAGFRIGRPLAESGPASEKLVRVRGLLRHLALEGADAAKKLPVADIERRLESEVAAAERDVLAAADERARAQARIDALAEEESRLRPIAKLPLRIEDYSGYESVKPFLGYADKTAAAELRSTVPEALVFEGEGGLLAAFVPAARAAAAGDVLYQHAWREHPAPAGAGEVASRLNEIATERETLQKSVSESEQRLQALRVAHGDFLIAAEEHLTIQVAKAEAPLLFATTENAFVVDCWIPESRFNAVRAELHRATGGNVHVETYDHVKKAMHGMDDVHGGHDAHAEHVSGHGDRDQPPTMLANPKGVKHFQFLTEMFSVPKYDEVDPTLVLSIAFPLFFGFMIGDLGLGLLMGGLGFLMMRKLGHVEGMKQLGFAIALAGVIAAIFGGLVFKDAMGIPLGSTAEIEHHVSEALAGSGGEAAAAANDTAGTVAAHASAVAATCDQIYKHAHEATWACLLSGGKSTGLGAWSEPIVYKITDVQTMLLLSVMAAFVHLGLGLLIGVRNETGHGWKHLTAKFGWLVLLLTFFPAVVALLRPDMFLDHAGDAAGHAALTWHLPITTVQAYMIAGGGFVVGAVVLGVTEGVVGVLEIPSMLSNILSYLRLGAVAIAKGAMAVAFNNLTLVGIALSGGGVLLVVVGLIAFVFVQALLFVLGLLSAGIQALRLNYVEFFTKFYKGGGEKFSPFGHERRWSTTSGGAAAYVAPAPVRGGGKE